MTSISKNDGQKIVSDFLNQGSYSVILLKSNGQLWRLDDLDEFSKRGLKENTDFIRYDIVVKDGVINNIKPDDIPILDEDRISFFERQNTIFSSNVQTISQEGLVELRLEYELKKTMSINEIQQITFNFTLPNEVQLIEESVLVNNKKSNYEVTNDNLSITLSEEKGTIKFFVKPIHANKFEIKSEAFFNYHHSKLQEVLGIVEVNVYDLTITGVNETNTSSVAVSGIGPSSADVKVYDGNHCIGVARTNRNGKWKATVNLHNPFNGSYHQLKAKIEDRQLFSSEPLVSDALNVRYKEEAPSIESVIMYHANRETDLTNALLKGETPVMTFVPEHAFTFKVKVDHAELVDELFISSKRNHEEKVIKAVYDPKKDEFIASGYFDPQNHSYVPGFIGVYYKVKNQTYQFDKDINYLQSIANSLPDTLRDATVDIIKNTENHSQFEITLKDENNTKFNITSRTEEIPSHITVDNATSLGYKKVNENVYTKLTEIESEGSTVLTVIDFTAQQNVSYAIDLIQDGQIVPSWSVSSVLFNSLQIGSDILGWMNKEENMKLIKNQIMNSTMTPSEREETLGELEYYSNLKDAATILSLTVSVASFAGLFAGPIGIVAGLGLVVTDILLSEYLNDLIGGLISPKWLIDPSGYVYEAVESNRIEGVTTTVYYQDEETKEAIKWNAEEYDQMNPLVTDKQGTYAWDVPEGLWQVKYELDGYETKYSEWLPVPPPQTTVNVGLISYVKPEITVSNLYDNRLEITFNKYMNVSTINEDVITLTKNDEMISFKLEAQDAEMSPTGILLAKKFKLSWEVDQALDLGDTINLVIGKEIKTYSGVTPDDDLSLSKQYDILPQNLLLEDSYEVMYGETLKVGVKVDQMSLNQSLYLKTISALEELVSVKTPHVQIENGEAVIELEGILPGTTDITIEIEGMDLKRTVKVNVVLDEQSISYCPEILVEDITIELGTTFNVMDGVIATDIEDGDLTDQVTVEGTVNTNQVGTYLLRYQVTDSDENSVTVERVVTVIGNSIMFPDVEEGKWYSTHIVEFSRLGYINGYSDGTFKPQNSITRAEFVKIVNKAFDLSSKFTPVTDLPFTDLDSQWKKDELKLALAAGYITPAVEFRHNEPINRQEAAKIVGYLLGNKLQSGLSLDFTDANEIATWAQDYVSGLVEAGVLSKNETFRPKDPITRAEAVKMLNIARGL